MTYPTDCFASLGDTLCPLKQMSPSMTRSSERPANVDNNVVLPDPDVPRIARNDPAGTRISSNSSSIFVFSNLPMIGSGIFPIGTFANTDNFLISTSNDLVLFHSTFQKKKNNSLELIDLSDITITETTTIQELVAILERVGGNNDEAKTITTKAIDGEYIIDHSEKDIVSLGIRDGIVAKLKKRSITQPSQEQKGLPVLREKSGSSSSSSTSSSSTHKACKLVEKEEFVNVAYTDQSTKSPIWGLTKPDQTLAW
ncbi:hypothetical protein DFA_04630 [Cavenderia fasciculata]|uniref:Uncharacterized protein n=1 Tax=Cavenderia fasciculata TaxID=261658 RepID=F4PQ39_CACFS|nr:uncharacterized protein DFA_04630 [Cavenderia fasciculata]EGG22502.1 hypothetical protein DFA_04630 [Cavenderia fasciculata]|eukprot:XP_004360353.1 hypothetical protein DFA_04630 [Cavenderia fasciculata]